MCRPTIVMCLNICLHPHLALLLLHVLPLCIKHQTKCHLEVPEEPWYLKTELPQSIGRTEDLVRSAIAKLPLVVGTSVEIKILSRSKISFFPSLLNDPGVRKVSIFHNHTSIFSSTYILSYISKFWCIYTI